jgi:hypothetical protein
MADEQVVDTTTQDTGNNDAGQRPEATPGQQNAPVPGQPQNTAGRQQPPVEDPRIKGILADLQKERKARQEFETRLTAADARYESERRRVQALAGITQETPEQVEINKVRERLSQILPGIEKLTNAQTLEKLLQLSERADSLDEATNHHWTQHGQNMLDQVIKGVASSIGGTLSERQQARVKQAYAQAAEADPEFLARHSRSDPSLIKEFVQSWVDDWFEPARRKVTQTEVDRLKRVPGGRDRSVAPQGGKKIDYNNPKSVEDAMVASFRDHGGEFGG